MYDVINSLLSHADALRWLFFLALLWTFYRWMQGDDSNGIEWRDFISAPTQDGKFHGDTNKLWQNVGGLCGSVAIVQISAHAHDDFLGFAAVLGVYFAFVGGVAGYAAFLRSKQGSVTTTTAPAPVPTPTIVTVVETPPVKEKHEP